MSNINIVILLGILWQTAVPDPNRFNSYLVLAYTAMWLIGLIYVISLTTRQRNLEQDLRLMQQILQENEETTS